MPAMKRVPLAISMILLLCAGANAQSEVDLGTTQDGTYTNSGFGFSFKYPKDWVVHGQATNERIRELGKEKIAESGAASKANIDVALNNMRPLLTKAGPQVLLNEPVECQFGGSQFFRDDYLLEVNGARVFQAYFVAADLRG